MKIISTKVTPGKDEWTIEMWTNTGKSYVKFTIDNPKGDLTVFRQYIDFWHNHILYKGK